MAEPKVMTMVIKVDLKCQKCYKKIKKVLCKFPRREIRDQVYDEKKNTVTIKVVCSCPEKIKHKICSKGGRTVKDIQIIPPSKPPATPPPPVPLCCRECHEGRGSGPCYSGYGYPPRGYYGVPVYEIWSGGGYRSGCYVCRCDDYHLIEGRLSICSIM